MTINDGDFTGKAELYSKYRHLYPKEIIRLLNEKYRFTRDMVVGLVHLQHYFLRMKIW